MDKWKIWFEVFRNGKKIGSGLWHQEYASKGSAIRRAKAVFDDPVKQTGGKTYKYIVSQTNPFEK